MSHAESFDPMHPILECTATVATAVKAVADVDPLFMAPADKAAALAELGAITAQVAELRLRLLGAAGDLADATGAKDAAAWLAATLPVDRRAAHGDLALAGDLARWLLVRQGMADGVVSAEQARVIVRVLGDLPDDLAPDILTAAEAELVRLAAVHSPEDLRRLGAHLLTVVAPEVADELEAKRLAAAEKRAAANTRFSMRALGDGTTRLSGRVPDAVAARLRTALESFAQPRVAALRADGRALPYHRLMGEALGQLLETLDPQRMPLHGGDATTITVTVSLDQLKADLGTGFIEGEGLTATEIRRLACTASILPAVLDGQGQVLDLGRSKRLFTAAQRKSLRLTHKTCRAEGCTVKARWCDAHHDESWIDGGTTDLANGSLLCGHHHHRAHDRAYTTHRLSNGDYRFTRRT